MMSLLSDSVRAEIAKCNRCGFCQAACPVYRITGREAATARGHNAHLTAVVEGAIALDRDLGSPMNECLLCRACTAHCPPAIRSDVVVIGARAALASGGLSVLKRIVFRRLLPEPRRLTRWVRLVAAAKRTRLSEAAKLLAWLPGVGRGMSAAAEMMPGGNEFLRDRLARLELRPPRPRGRVIYFVGCGLNFALPGAGEATLRLLAACGYEVAVPENFCCGLPPHVYGDLEAARLLARRNLDLLGRLEGEAIITDCASCSAFLKKYPELLAGDPAHSQAQRLAERVRDLTEFLAQVDLPNLPIRRRVAEVSVTYHDPCHLSRYQDLRRQPRELLKAVSGIAYRELPEADWCCGGAGTYALAHAELSQKILDRKMRNVKKTGAQVVVAPCPSCILQLSFGAKRHRLPVKVKHLSEVLLG
jgi:glycolate oxidase iron-sulfur subunit